MAGKVFKNLRLPEVTHSADRTNVMITLNGDEDEFVVLQMAGGSAGDLARKLLEAGFGEGPRR